MTKPERLNTQQATDAINRLGPATVQPNGTAHCPVCGPTGGGHDHLWTLSISPNGDGAAYTCTTGCTTDAIEATLRLALSAIPAPIDESSALNRLRLQLHMLDPVRKRLDDLGRVVRYGADGDMIELHFEDGRKCALGDAQQLGERDYFYRRLRTIGVIDPVWLKPADYRELAQAIHDASEFRQGAGTANDEALDWVAHYLRTTHQRTAVDLGTTEGKLGAIESLNGTGACSDTEGRLWIRPGALGLFLRRQQIENITDREIQIRLARLGFAAGQLSARDLRGDKHQTRAWRSQPGFSLEQE